MSAVETDVLCLERFCVCRQGDEFLLRSINARAKEDSGLEEVKMLVRDECAGGGDCCDLLLVVENGFGKILLDRSFWSTVRKDRPSVSG